MPQRRPGATCFPGALRFRCMKGLLVSPKPVHYRQRAKRVPSARVVLALVHFYEHHAWIPSLKRPRPIAVALRLDKLDRRTNPFIVRNARASQVLKAPQYVVVPPRREGEARPHGTTLAISFDHLLGRQAAEEASLEKILLPRTRASDHWALAS